MKDDKINIKDEELIYYIMAVKYTKTMGREVFGDINVNRDLYPRNWFLNKNYIEKSNVLAEAIQKKCLIRETEGYLKTIEGYHLKDK